MVPPRPICLIASLLRGSNTANQVERDFPTRRYSGRSRQARTEQDRKHAFVLEERERELSQDIADQSAHVLLPIVSASTRCRMSWTSISTGNPFASISASVQPLREAASNSRARRRSATAAGLGAWSSGGGAWSVAFRISGGRGPFQAAPACFPPRGREDSRRYTWPGVRGGGPPSGQPGGIRGGRDRRRC